VRPLSPLESVALFSVGGSVLAVFVPVFVEHLHASRLTEPIEALQRIGSRATLIAAGQDIKLAYPESVPLTPAEVPAGEAVEDPEGTWQHPTWQLLEFKFERPHHYSFAFDSKNSPAGSQFTARAHGDLDGDGLYSTFKVMGEYEPGAEPVLYPMEMDREIE